MEEVWYTLEDIEESDDASTLYCITVDAPEKQFLAGDLGIPTHNSDQGKEEDAMKGEANMIIGSIARLGRAAGVHLIIATQRPDAKLIPGETKANLGVRINCGRTNSTASSMILESAEGTKVRANPRGRLYLQIYGRGDHGQGFFAEQSWIDEYLASQGLNPDGTPLAGRKSQLANLADMSQFEGNDLDTREGIDNGAAIDNIRTQETEEEFEALMEDEGLTEEEDPDLTASLRALEEEDPEGEPQEAGTETYTLQEDAEALAELEEGPKVREDGFAELKLSEGPPDMSKWERPEDDWDDDLESLIEENYKE